MKDKSQMLSVLLRTLSGLSVLLAVYGVWWVAVAGLKLEDGAGKYTLVSTAAAFCIMVLRWGLSRTKTPPWVLDVLAVVLSVGLVVGSAFLWYHVFVVKLGGVVVAVIINLAAMFVGDICGRKQPGMYAIMGTGGVLLLCAGIVKLILLENAPPMDGFVWIFFLGAGCITAGANYNSIDRNMSRRGHSKSRLPEKVRRNNLLLVVGLFAGGSLLIAVRKPLANGLQAAIRGIILAVNWLISAILDLFPMAPGFGAGNYNKYNSGAADGAVSRSPEWIIWLVFGLCVAFLVWIIARPVKEWLQQKLEKLRSMLLRWLRKRNRGNGGEVSGDYVDVTEEISGELSVPKKTRITGLRGWKREMRKFSRMPAGRERFVEGYRLLLRGSTLRGAKLSLSDTPQETGEKMKPVLSGADMDAVTAQAEEIVFSGHEADTDTAGLEEALEILKKKN